LDDVHSAYVAMAASGRVTSSQRTVFDSACEQFIQEAKVDAILLGGTDLALVYKEDQTQFPVVDCAAIHVDAVVRHATS
jgi:aspartate racemase